MNKQRKGFNSRLLFSLLLLVIGGSLLLNSVMKENKQKPTNEPALIAAGKTDKTYKGTIKRINADQDEKFKSFFLTDVTGDEDSMFNSGVTIFAENLKISGKKTTFEELAEGDKIELITVENAPVTMMIPPSIAGNAVVGINVL